MREVFAIFKLGCRFRRFLRSYLASYRDFYRNKMQCHLDLQIVIEAKKKDIQKLGMPRHVGKCVMLMANQTLHGSHNGGSHVFAY